MKSGKKHSYLSWLVILIALGFAVWLAPLPGQYEELFDNRQKPSRSHKQEQKKTHGSKVVALYLVNTNGQALEPREETIDTNDSLPDQLKKTAQSLFREQSGPSSPLFPGGIFVRNVFVYNDICVISLGGEFRKRQNCGAWTELLEVYSIVDTLTRSFDEIKKVQILIDDMESEFFVSHVSIDGIITPDYSFITGAKQ